MLTTDVASSLVGIDDVGVVWAAGALVLPVEARVNGVDLLTKLLVACVRETSDLVPLAERRHLDIISNGRHLAGRAGAHVT